MSLKKESSSETGEDKQKPKKAGKRGKKTFLVLGAVAVIAVAAAASYFFFGMNEAGSFFNGRPAHAEKEKQKPKQVVDLGDVVVNLADSGSTHYLRVTIVLEFFENKKLIGLTAIFIMLFSLYGSTGNFISKSKRFCLNGTICDIYLLLYLS